MSGLAAYQGRVAAEKAELDDRLTKLVTFFDSPTFAGLDGNEKNRLSRQAVAMQAYSSILGERIAVFTCPEEFR